MVDAFARMRFSDGFSHAHALAFMITLVAVQGIIVAVGLAEAIGGNGFTDVVAATVHGVVPGPAGQALTAAITHAHATASEHHYTALFFGTIGTLISATGAFGQLERALNRLYGVEQDRPAWHKYGQALMLTLTAGSAATVALVFRTRENRLGQNCQRHGGDGVEHPAVAIGPGPDRRSGDPPAAHRSPPSTTPTVVVGVRGGDRGRRLRHRHCRGRDFFPGEPLLRPDLRAAGGNGGADVLGHAVVHGRDLRCCHRRPTQAVRSGEREPQDRRRSRNPSHWTIAPSSP